jgi:predicted NBD/HSP70 family sugar kinase
VTIGDRPERRRRQQRVDTASVTLRTVLDQGPVARSTIARATGLSPATITAHVAEFASRGLVRELPVSTVNGLGRPHVPVDLEPDLAVGGIHIGLEETTVALLDLRGGVRAQHLAPHGGEPPESVVKQAADVLRGLWAGCAPGMRLLGVGVATGGWVDPRSGVLAEHVLLGWREVKVAALLERLLGVCVRIDSHARSLARAEQLFGDTRSRESVLTLFVGNVVEAAFALGDDMIRGPRSHAGVVAHLPVPDSDVPCDCGRVGCLQAVVSERRIIRLALAAGCIDRPHIDEVVAAAGSGDDRARGLLRDRAAQVGRAAATISDLLNPAIIVVMENGVIHFPDCLGVLRAEFALHAASERDPADVVIATSFPDDRLAIAAGGVMLDAVYRDPLAFTEGSGDERGKL